jgi:transposase-like protein
MKEITEHEYVKRTQKDYSYTFKLRVVQEYETGNISKGELKRKYGIQGDATIRTWIEKYGNFDWSNKTKSTMPKSSEQKSLEKQVEQSEKKAIIFDMMIDLAEEEYNISIRKNSLPEQSKTSKK